MKWAGHILSALFLVAWWWATIRLFNNGHHEEYWHMPIVGALFTWAWLLMLGLEIHSSGK